MSLTSFAASSSSSPVPEFISFRSVRFSDILSTGVYVGEVVLWVVAGLLLRRSILDADCT